MRCDVWVMEPQTTAPVKLQKEPSPMSLKRRLSVRSSVDLKDVRQVRALKERFRVTEEELSRIVERAGASIAAIGQRCRDGTRRWAAGLT